MIQLTDTQEQILGAVRRFVAKDVLPVASELEHRDEYPAALVRTMREMGLFGATIPAEHGGMGLDVLTYALIVEELSRGWMSLSGVLNTHLMVAYHLRAFGTPAQRERWLPRMATGELHGGLGLSEPHAGSDVQAIRTTAVRRGDRYVVNGTKMFITNGRRGNIFSLAVKTDPKAQPPYKGISLLLVEKGHPGFQVGRDLKKLGYKGIETCELIFEDVEVPAGNLIGGV
ncbi:MAG TPA: acyl-CoA dehydrogenase family protein, partial [Streptosporangiaceae bacterium]|nr:acyl-CoA dehydrogenase family protein [Streptosporangiaceae bacterium]